MVTANGLTFVDSFCENIDIFKNSAIFAYSYNRQILHYFFVLLKVVAQFSLCYNIFITNNFQGGYCMKAKNATKKVVALVAGVSLFATLFGTAGVSARAEESNTGTLKILSCNVAGLPAILSSGNPSENSVAMGSYFNDYDVVNVQEDFAYDDDLCTNITLPYRTPTSGNVPLGDGMNTFSNYELYETTRVKWDDSYGFITNGADQMTPKGFLYSSIKLADGVFLDIYDLHTDADTDDGSMAARQSNLEQLAEYIETRSDGRAVIVFGDTNCRYTRDKIAESILDPCGLTDAWVELIRDGVAPEYGADALIDSENMNSADNEVVDKIWYRSGGNIDLQAVYYALQEDFVDEDGECLSDHWPITATFEYTVKEDILTSETFGGGGGTGFSFLTDMDNRFPDKVAISTGTRLDRVEFTYEDTVASAGGTGGTYRSLDLADGEYITSMTVCKAKKSWTGTYRISYIKLTTNLGNTLEGGTSNSSSYTFTAPDGYAIAGLQGCADSEVDRLGAIYKLIK